MGNHSEEERKRHNAARIALFAYALCVLTAGFGIYRLLTNDTNSAAAYGLSAIMLLASAIISTLHTRGY